MKFKLILFKGGYLVLIFTLSFTAKHITVEFYRNKTDFEIFQERALTWLL